MANVIVARRLTPEAVGLYAVTFSVVTVVSAVGRMGLPRLIVRQVSASLTEGRPGHARAGIIACMKLTAAASVVVLFLSAAGGARSVLGGFGGTSWNAGVAALSLWISLEVLRLLPAEAFRGLHELGRATVLGDASRSVLTAFLLLAGSSLARRITLGQMIALSAVASGLVAVSAITALWRRLPRLSGSGVVSTRDLLRSALPMMVAEMTALALSQSSLWVAGWTITDDKVALFAVALRVSSLLILPILAVNAVLAPFIARLCTRGDDRSLELLLRSAAAAATLIMVVVAGAIALLGRSTLGMLFGPFYKDAFASLLLLALGQIGIVATGSCATTLMMTGHERPLMIATIVTLFVSVPIQLFAAIQAGLVGLASTAAICTVLQSAVLAVIVKRRVGIGATCPLTPHGWRRAFVFLRDERHSLT